MTAAERNHDWYVVTPAIVKAMTLHPLRDARDFMVVCHGHRVGFVRLVLGSSYAEDRWRVLACEPVDTVETVEIETSAETLRLALWALARHIATRDRVSAKV